VGLLLLLLHQQLLRGVLYSCRPAVGPAWPSGADCAAVGPPAAAAAAAVCRSCCCGLTLLGSEVVCSGVPCP